MGKDPNSIRFRESPIYGTLISFVRMCIDTGPRSPGFRREAGAVAFMCDCSCEYVPGPPDVFHGDVNDNLRVIVCDAIF